MSSGKHSARGARESLNILMLGTRGIPARYGGFETAVEEVAPRLARFGHVITVYCRASGPSRPATFDGVRLVHRPALRRKTLETLSHTAACLPHAARQRRQVVVGFNAANAPLLAAFRLARVPLAIHVDGLESERAKWSYVGRRYYRGAEWLSARIADEIVADAIGIQAHYQDVYDRATTYIPYGADVIKDDRSALDGLRQLGLEPLKYHLIVARFEPENHVLEMVEGYRASNASGPLVVVGSFAYESAYGRRLRSAIEGDESIRWLGRVDDRDLLNQLYRGTLLYLHGHSVGGTNPSLLRAMGAGSATAAFDVIFNREVLGETGAYFRDAKTVSRQIELAERDPERTCARGEASQVRAATNYRWDDVARRYESMLLAMHLTRYGPHK